MLLSSTDSEAVWIERAKQGDLDAFEKLYRLYVRQVHGVCRRLLASKQDAEDMTQGVFLRAWRRLDSFRGKSQFGTWLRRIAVNLVIDERKTSRPETWCKWGLPRRRRRPSGCLRPRSSTP